MRHHRPEPAHDNLPFSPPERRAAVGCLLGTAVGDALGLTAEGLSRCRQQAVYPNLDRYHLLLGKGLCSDDTEHVCMTAAALIAAAANPEAFLKTFGGSLSWRFRFCCMVSGDCCRHTYEEHHDHVPMTTEGDRLAAM